MVRRKSPSPKRQHQTVFKPPKGVCGSAGVWSGDGLAQIRIRVNFVGTADLLLKLVPDFSTDAPSIVEPVLSMCLRDAAHHAGQMLKKYVPKKNIRDFLPFLMVDASQLVYRSFQKESVPITISNREGKEEVVGHVPMNRVTNWSLQAEIVIAHFPGVDRESIATLFAKAGTEIGLGAHRPRNGGKFGTFQLTELDVLKGKWPPAIETVRRANENFVDVGEQIDEIRSRLQPVLEFEPI